ncbi:MAG: glycosyl hydrolase 115 family protein, partial [Lachnospiraceae bacterium]|nr:glycosyl hydrolase 115 family protein [Lachnospiraceae bacterium]
MKKRLLKTIASSVMVMAMSLTVVSGGQYADAAKKASLKTKSLEVVKGKTKKISIKNKKKKNTYTFKTNKKKIATVSKKGVVKAKKAGKAKITIVSKKNKKVKAMVNITVNKKKTKKDTTPKPEPTGNPPTGNPPTGNPPTASPEPSGNNPQTEPITLYNGKMIAPIIMDAGYEVSESNTYAERSYRQIVRAVTDLRQDIAMVTGAIDYKEIQAIFNDSAEDEEERLYFADSSRVPAFVTDTSGIKADYAIIAGTIDDSAIIKNLIDSGKLDEAKGLKGAWEGYVIKQVKNPIKGVDNALVIAGSDARGTIYGIYTISEGIGVSPFYWYSDVPVVVKDIIEFDAVTPIIEDGPDVKYRGIFINDEEASNKWAKTKFTEDGTKAPGVNYYRKVFELILRMKANTLWPAMHGCSTAFNKVINEYGEPVNAKEASEYGIVMSTSHCEILLRNNVGEWADWFNQNKGRFSDVQYPNDSSKAYDFTINRELILEYSRDRLTAIKDFE